mgnify:CR=1 FL=1
MRQERVEQAEVLAHLPLVDDQVQAEALLGLRPWKSETCAKAGIKRIFGKDALNLEKELEAAQDFARKLQRGNSEMQNASNAMQERFNDTIHLLQKEALEQQGHLKDELEAGRTHLQQVAHDREISVSRP